VLFQPAGNPGSRDHYRDTIERPVPIDHLRQFLDEQTLTSVREAVDGDAVATWGVTPGRTGVNERKWDRIAAGDIAVFLRDSRAYSSGIVVLKTRNARLAEDLWGKDEQGQTWECMYFLKDVQPSEVSYSDLNFTAQFDAGNPFQGFNILTAERAPEVLALLGRDGPEQRVWWVNQGTSYRHES